MNEWMNKRMNEWMDRWVHEIKDDSTKYGDHLQHFVQQFKIKLQNIFSIYIVIFEGIDFDFVWLSK